MSLERRRRSRGQLTVVRSCTRSTGALHPSLLDDKAQSEEEDRSDHNVPSLFAPYDKFIMMVLLVHVPRHLHMCAGQSHLTVSQRSFLCAKDVNGKSTRHTRMPWLLQAPSR